VDSDVQKVIELQVAKEAQFLKLDLGNNFYDVSVAKSSP